MSPINPVVVLWFKNIYLKKKSWIYSSSFTQSFVAAYYLVDIWCCFIMNNKQHASRDHENYLTAFNTNSSSLMQSVASVPMVKKMWKIFYEFSSIGALSWCPLVRGNQSGWFLPRIYLEWTPSWKYSLLVEPVCLKCGPTEFRGSLPTEVCTNNIVAKKREKKFYWCLRQKTNLEKMVSSGIPKMQMVM